MGAFSSWAQLFGGGRGGGPRNLSKQNGELWEFVDELPRPPVQTSGCVGVLCMLRRAQRRAQLRAPSPNSLSILATYSAQMLGAAEFKHSLTFLRPRCGMKV